MRAEARDWPPVTVSARVGKPSSKRSCGRAASRTPGEPRRPTLPALSRHPDQRLAPQRGFVEPAVRASRSIFKRLATAGRTKPSLPPGVVMSGPAPRTTLSSSLTDVGRGHHFRLKTRSFGGRCPGSLQLFLQAAYQDAQGNRGGFNLLGRQVFGQRSRPRSLHS